MIASMPERSDNNRAGLLSRIWRSVLRAPLTVRTSTDRKRIVLNHLVLHFRPIQLPEKTLKYTHTFGLGGMSLVLVILLALTGVLLMFVYEPSPGRAYASVVRLQEEVRFGQLVRNVHHWSANFLVVVVFLHLLRVFYTGAFHGTRQFNWVIGLAALFGVLASNFTGYLLPWDQLSYWAVTICTGMIGYAPVAGPWFQEVVRGGAEIGSSTLTIFYTLHTTVVPVLLVILLPLHFWRVRKAGGVVVPRGLDEHPEDTPAEKPKRVLFVPNLLVREFAVALILIAFVLVWSIVFDAGLGAPANPGMSPNPAKAPWYFLGLQELLLHFHPFFAVIFIPTVAVVALLLIPYIRYDSDLSGPWFLSRRGRVMASVAAVTALVATPVWIVLDESWVDFGAWLSGVPPFIADGLLPVGILFVVLVGWNVYLKKKFSASKSEQTQALFTLLMVAFAVLTATGIWFRGAGMGLMWPWSN
jgi:quinol-cytochrome oxidoreductase complex cytochrome b subunit